MLYTLIYKCHLDIYWYICRISCSTTRCTDGGGPWGHTAFQWPWGGGASPCPEDDEFFYAPDAESQEEAINRFMETCLTRLAKRGSGFSRRRTAFTGPRRLQFQCPLWIGNPLSFTCCHVEPSRNDVATNGDYVLCLYCYIPSIYSDIDAMCTGKHEEFHWLCKPWHEPAAQACSQAKRVRNTAPVWIEVKGGISLHIA